MTPEKIQILIQKYKTGSCSNEEIAELNHWLENLEEDHHSDFRFIDDAHEQNLKDEIRSNIREGIKQRTFRKRFFATSWVRIAASVLLVSGTSVFAWIYWQSLRNKPIELVEVYAGSGEMKEVILPDGSSVHLNAKTRFKYEKDFSGKTRQVYLEGEAFFKVTRNPEKPFIIKTAQLQTKVLGTSFNIKAYPGTEKEEVTVVTGKVNVQNPQSSINLLPNQKVVYNLQNRQLSQINVSNAHDYLAWTEGRLVFEDASLTEIVEVLSRKYDVRIELGNVKMKKCMLNAQFKNEQLEKILEKLCLFLDASYYMKDGHVIIKGNGC